MEDFSCRRDDIRHLGLVQRVPWGINLCWEEISNKMCRQFGAMC